MFVHVIGDEWFWWVGEIIALVLITLVLAHLVPLWTLAVAALLLLRPLSRLLVLAVRSAIDELPM
jgi:hypothetical protein